MITGLLCIMSAVVGWFAKKMHVQAYVDKQFSYLKDLEARARVDEQKTPTGKKA